MSGGDSEKCLGCNRRGSVSVAQAFLVADFIVSRNLPETESERPNKRGAGGGRGIQFRGEGKDSRGESSRGTKRDLDSSK